VHPGNNPLHRARIRRGLSLSQLTARTLLSPRIVQKIDDGRFAELPGGLYARSYIRTFATAVGLDPEETVLELAEHLPPAQDPFPAMREIARAGDPAWLTAIEDARMNADRWLEARRAALHGMRDQVRTVLTDAAALVVLLAFMIQLTAWACELPRTEAIEQAGLAVAVVWGLLVAAYFLILGSPARRVRRALVCRLPVADGAAPGFHLPTILGRALSH
jgi:hypothetical protein